MHKLYKMGIITLILCMLTACSKADPNSNISSECSTQPSNFYDAVVRAPCVYFQSLAEMKDDILTNNFSEEEISNIQRFLKDENGQIPSFDVQNLYEPTTPADMSFSKILWEGSSYSFEYNYAGTYGSSFYIKIIPQHSFNTWLEIYFTKYKDQNIRRIMTIETDPERDATVYAIRNAYNEVCKSVLYTIASGEKILYISEFYVPESSPGPTYISILGEYHNQYFWISMFDFPERPSLEWLSSFGLREYTETSAS